MGTRIRGKGSWFGGPNDSMAGNVTASGRNVSFPGIAVYNHSTLGGFWLVRAPNGRKRLIRQTDIGPAPWTGRVIDFTSSALGKFGYSEGNFPTDAGTFKARYLGKDRTRARQIAGAVGGSGGGGGSSGGTRTIPGVDRSGLRRAAIASYLVNEPNDVAPSVNAKSPMTIANQGDQSGDNLIALTQQLSAIKDTPSRTVPSGGASAPSGHSGNSAVDRMLSMARAFDKHHTTYLWGGGHGGIAGPADRVDCSGYVSAILHAGGLLNTPMTSGGLMGWGHPGRGKYVTVWANGGHVLIEILGKFYATSGENPGGGPGLRSTPSSSYLSAFTPRHPALP